MTAERSTRRGTGKRTPRRDSATELEPETVRPTHENRYVDIDPWAILLEGLMEMPEEKPAERTRPKGK